MEILDQLQPLLENIGFPALIFAIWYIYHQSQVKAFEKIIQLSEERPITPSSLFLVGQLIGKSRFI